MWFEEFQDGCHSDHLGYRNRTILGILNLHVAPMPPIKFGLNSDLAFGSRYGLKIFKMAIMAATLDIQTE